MRLDDEAPLAGYAPWPWTTHGDGVYDAEGNLILEARVGEGASLPDTWLADFVLRAVGAYVSEGTRPRRKITRGDDD